MADAGQALLGGLALRQQRRQDKFNNEQVMVQQNQSISEALISSAAAIAQKSREAGKEFDLTAFRERLEGHVMMAGKLRQQQFQTDPDIISSSIASALSQFDAATAAAGLTPTPSEAAVTGAKAGVAGAAAAAGALTEAGRPTTIDETAVSADLVPAAGEPEKASVANFRMPDGSLQAVDLNDTAKVGEIINAGGVKISLSVQSPGLEGIGAVADVSKKEREDVKLSIQDTNAQIEEINESLRLFEETPEAGGLFGPIIEKAGGVIQQIDKLAGTDIAGNLDIDPAQVKTVRSNARALASRLLSTVTGEESGRFTDKEREIAEEVLGTLDPTSSTEQISAALNQALSLMKRSEGREMVRFLQASGADLSTTDGETAFVEALISNGFTQDRAIDAMLDLKARLNFD